MVEKIKAPRGRAGQGAGGGAGSGADSAFGRGGVAPADGGGLFIDADALKRAIRTLVQATLEEEIERHLGAARHERGEARRGYRNGYKPRTILMRAGKLELAVPQTRDGGFQPSLWERWQRSEAALVMAIQEMYVRGVSTRKVGEVMKRLGGHEVSAATVSRASAELDAQIKEFRERSLAERSWPYVIIDARYEKVRRDKRVVSTAVLVVAGVDEEGRREILGFQLGDSESEETWGAVFDDLKRRGVKGVELVVSDAHAGIRKAMEKKMQGVAWQRCRVHLMRELMNKASHRDRKELAEDLRAIWASEQAELCLAAAEEAAKKWEARVPKLAQALRGEGVEQTLTVLALPREHRRRLHSTNLLERLMRTLKQRTRVVGVFPSESSAERLIGAMLLEVNDEWLGEGMRYLNMDRRN